jgi:hypothetical protein
MLDVDDTCGDATYMMTVTTCGRIAFDLRWRIVRFQIVYLYKRKLLQWGLKICRSQQSPVMFWTRSISPSMIEGDASSMASRVRGRIFNVLEDPPLLCLSCAFPVGGSSWDLASYSPRDRREDFVHFLATVPSAQCNATYPGEIVVRIRVVAMGTTTFVLFGCLQVVLLCRFRLHKWPRWLCEG